MRIQVTNAPNVSENHGLYKGRELDAEPDAKNEACVWVTSDAKARVMLQPGDFEAEEFTMGPRTTTVRGRPVMVTADGDGFVARSSSPDIASQGGTADEAEAALAEALDLFDEDEGE